MTTGERIKTARKMAGLTQKELGDKLGVTQVMISAYESNLRNPKIGTLNRIAQVLDISLSELLDNEYDFLGFSDEMDLDNYVHELGEFLYYNPKHKVLFDATMEVEQKDINLAKALLDRINGKLPESYSDK